MKVKFVPAIGVFAGLFAFSAHASVVTFTATLSGSNEVPPTGSAGVGFVAVTLDTILQTLTVNESFSGLTTPATAAHIHCCGPLGINEAVAVPFTAFPATVSGTYSNTFDLTAASTYLPAFVTAEGGTTGAAESALIAGLESGQTYANIHDAMFPGGEIRGQLSATPEPGSAALAGIGMLLVVFSMLRGRVAFSSPLTARTAPLFSATRSALPSSRWFHA